MLPSSSRVSPVTYHSVVAVRYPDLCREINHIWELGSFASGGIPDRPPGFQFVLWDTEAKINGLVAADLNTLVAHVIRDLQDSTNFSDGLFVMTTATDHKNNLNRSTIKKNFSRALRVETIANSAGGTAAAAIVAQPSTGFLNGHFYADGSPTEDTEDCLGRITVGLTRSKSLTIVISPLDMIGLIGMAQVLATLAYGIKGLRRGTSTWDWPYFHNDPHQENASQMERWSLNQAPTWTVPPLVIANRHYDTNNQLVQTPATGSSSPRPLQPGLAHSRQAPQHSCPRRLAPLGTPARPALQRSDPIRIFMQQTTHPDQLTSVCPPIFIMRVAAGSCSNQDPIKR